MYQQHPLGTFSARCQSRTSKGWFMSPHSIIPNSPPPSEDQNHKEYKSHCHNERRKGKWGTSWEHNPQVSVALNHGKLRMIQSFLSQNFGLFMTMHVTQMDYSGICPEPERPPLFQYPCTEATAFFQGRPFQQILKSGFRRMPTDVAVLISWQEAITQRRLALHPN